MKPSARFKKAAAERRQPTEPDIETEAAVKAAAEALAKMAPGVRAVAVHAVNTVLITYFMKLAQMHFNNSRVRNALQSERPWDMVKLIDKNKAEAAAIAGALPIVADLVAEMDPSGKKPLFEYSKDEIERMFEAVIWCWEESKAERSKIGGEDFIPM
mgnify:CR=1 FL=1